MCSKWDSAAGLRRSQIEGGLDLTFSKVFVPAYCSMFNFLRPSSVLEVGSGTGHLALELSRLTDRYVGLEPSTGMITHAREVLEGRNVMLVHSSIENFMTEERFDLVLSHLCLQTVGNYLDFLSAAAKLLAKGGIFLISIPHPAFFNDYKKIFPNETFSYMEERHKTIDFSITLDSTRTIAGVPYFHRPLDQYMLSLSRAGLSLCYLNEIFPSVDVQALYGSPWKTPRYLIFGGTTSTFTPGCGGHTYIADRLQRLPE
jgi:SAM-dependent methyltransferase